MERTADRDSDEFQDQQAMAKLAAGDGSALRGLVIRHYALVHRVGLRVLRQQADADDVAQEVFLRLAESAGRWRCEAQLSTLLYRMTLNLALDETRRRKRRGDVPLDKQPEQAAEDASPSDGIERQEVRSTVRTAVDALPERQRMCLLLHRYEGLGYRAIAAVMEISESAVESLLTRAYATLRVRLGHLAEANRRKPAAPNV